MLEQQGMSLLIIHLKYVLKCDRACSSPIANKDMPNASTEQHRVLSFCYIARSNDHERAQASSKLPACNER
jgi:hypothetical protein